MNLIKGLFNFVLSLVAIMFAGSFYLIRHYKNHVQDFKFEAQFYKKSRRWVIIQHVNVCGAIVVCIFMNLFCWGNVLFYLFNKFFA